MYKNVPDCRTRRSPTLDIDWAQKTEKPKRVMQNLFGASVFDTEIRLRQEAFKLTNTLDEALRPNNEDFPWFPEQGTAAAPESVSQFLYQQKLIAGIRKFTQVKEMRIYALEIHSSFLKAAKEYPSNTFQIDNEYANDVLKNASFRCIESVRGDLVLKRAKKNILEVNISKRTE